MARSHVMTPARRAALRKAQLVSARNRRRRGVKSEIGRLGRQSVSTARASGSLARRRAVKNWKNPANRRRTIKRVAFGAAIVGVGAAAVAGSRTETFQVHKGVRKSMRKKNFNGAHPRGPVRKAYRQKHKASYRARVTPLVRHNVRRRKAKSRKR